MRFEKCLEVIPQTVLPSSFAEFSFTLLIVGLVSHLCYIPSKLSLRCLLLSVVILFLAGFYQLLATIFHPLVPRWVSLCVGVRLFSFNRAVQRDIQLWCFVVLVWWLQADRLDKLHIVVLYFLEWFMVVLGPQVGVIYCAGLQRLFTKSFTLLLVCV